MTYAVSFLMQSRCAHSCWTPFPVCFPVSGDSFGRSDECLPDCLVTASKLIVFQNVMIIMADGKVLRIRARAWSLAVTSSMLGSAVRSEKYCLYARLPSIAISAHPFKPHLDETYHRPCPQAVFPGSKRPLLPLVDLVECFAVPTR